MEYLVCAWALVDVIDGNFIIEDGSTVEHKFVSKVEIINIWWLKLSLGNEKKQEEWSKKFMSATNTNLDQDYTSLSRD